MTAPIHIDVAAAERALSRLDDGEGLPGDEALAEEYDAACRTGWDAHTLRQIEQAERDAQDWWTATFGDEDGEAL